MIRFQLYLDVQFESEGDVFVLLGHPGLFSFCFRSNHLQHIGEDRFKLLLLKPSMKFDDIYFEFRIDRLHVKRLNGTLVKKTNVLYEDVGDDCVVK